jgi:hypothetical protein
MNVKSIVVALAAMLTVAGGAAAVTGTGLSDAGTAASGDVTVETTYTNGAVTVTATQDGAPVENASVEVAGKEYITDANGTVTAENVDLEAGEELGVEVEGDGFEAELSYALQDGNLQLLEEEYRYEQAEDAEDEDEAEDEADDDEDEAEDDEGEADEAEDDDAEDGDEDDEEEADADDEEASEEDDD